MLRPPKRDQAELNRINVGLTLLALRSRNYRRMTSGLHAPRVWAPLKCLGRLSRWRPQPPRQSRRDPAPATSTPGLETRPAKDGRAQRSDASQIDCAGAEHDPRRKAADPTVASPIGQCDDSVMLQCNKRVLSERDRTGGVCRVLSSTAYCAGPLHRAAHARLRRNADARGGRHPLFVWRLPRAAAHRSVARRARARGGEMWMRSVQPALAG